MRATVDFGQFRTPRLDAASALAGMLLIALGGCGTAPEPTVAGPTAFIDDTSDLAPPYNSSSSPSTPSISEVKAWGDRYDADPASYDNARGFAEVLLAAGSLERVAEVVGEALLHHPTDGALSYIQARAYLERGNAELALQTLDSARLDSDWRHPSLRGICLDQLDRHDEAREAYRHALSISPANGKIYNNLGLSYALSGDPEQAESVLRKATGLDPSSARIRQNLALVLGAQGKFTEAEAISSKDLNPQEIQGNLEYYRWLLTPRRTWNELGDTPGDKNN